ncbi:MAG: hypothetical protein HFH32_15145 [Eubacterium sp.]|jgi:hypothetical protein|nr:hypothetical protein [Eubacterium sp.]
MEIFAKASLKLAELQEKINCGCDGIEFNLEKDFLAKGGSFETEYPKELFEMHNVGAVHYPFGTDRQMMNMEHIFQHEDLGTVQSVFRLAQHCAGIWGHRVLVIFHCSLSYWDFMEYELLRGRLEWELGQLFLDYPMVEAGIENVVPMEYNETGTESPRLCNGIFTDTVKIVQYLREIFGNRVGSVLDTCHAAMTEKYMKALLSEAEFLPKGQLPDKIDYSMEHYFRENQGICKLIHLNDFTGNGYQKNHGTGFAEQEKLNRLLDLYREYGYDCPLTLEVREKDYLDCVNYRRTKVMIQQWKKTAG